MAMAMDGSLRNWGVIALCGPFFVFLLFLFFWVYVCAFSLTGNGWEGLADTLLGKFR